MEWLSDHSIAHAGWKICFFLSPPPAATPLNPPQPPPPPLPPANPPSSPVPVIITGPCVLSGNCIQSSGYPNASYGNNELCQAYHLPAVPAHVVAFDVEPEPSCGWDFLYLAGIRYCSTTGPSGAVPTDGRMMWKSDHSGRRSGWKICFFELLPPPPELPPAPPFSPAPPAPPPDLFSIIGPCVALGNCIQSSGYPSSHYGPNEECIMSANLQNVSLEVEVVHFDVEPSYTAVCSADYMRMNGVSYCGFDRPVGVVLHDGRVTWVSDDVNGRD
eukprot:2356155-Prymnesium_polylepis.1